MKILLTGSSGFLGKEIQQNVNEDIELSRLSRSSGDILCDLSKSIPLLKDNIDRVVHSAGLAHVFGKKNSDAFYKVNVLGTVNLLKGLERNATLPKEIIFISSVSVYGLEKGVLISEENSLAAQDPYGKSKIAAESVLLKWCKENNVNLIILRLPLIVGHNAPGNLGKMTRGIQNRRYFSIGDGKVKKSMVLAKDVAQLCTRKDLTPGIFNLTDGFHPTFRELEQAISNKFNKPMPIVLPIRLAIILAFIGDVLNKFQKGIFPFDSKVLNKITSELTFDDSKAIRQLGWMPTKVLEIYKND